MMDKIIQNYDEGDTVWFVDSDLKHDYAEFGRVVAFTKNRDVVVDYLYGMSVFRKEDIFATKEECEKFIYISNIAKDLKGRGDKQINDKLGLEALELAYTKLCGYVEQKYGESCAELYERFLNEVENETNN